MIITDLVHLEIREQIAAHRPERGGALYGPKGYPAVTHFEYDADGETSAVSYVPSTRLITNVAHVERETGLQFKGIIHSHPPGYIRPSPGDEQTVASFFRLNPHFSAIALPIVQEQHAGLDNEKASFMRWYRAERREKKPARAGFNFSIFAGNSDNGVAIIDEDVYIVPLWEHVNKLLKLLRDEGLHLTVEKKVQHLKIANAELIGIVARSLDGHEFMYFVPFDYPVVAPIVLYQRKGVTNNLRVHWDGLADAEQSLYHISENLLEEWKGNKG